MFWDVDRRVLVDQASRYDYDGYTRQCSPQCQACVPCDAASCSYHTASAKLGLLLYASRVTGLESEPGLAHRLASMSARMWEGQLSDGGIPHAVYYAPDGAFLSPSGATGEATALAVLAYSVKR